MKVDIKKIIFTSDILRPFAVSPQVWEPAAWKNIRWLECLLGWQLSKAISLPQTRVSWDRNGGFNTPELYSKLGLKIGYDEWASFFYHSSLPKEAEEQLIEPFLNSLVVGVEISDVMQSVFTRNNIPFIDIVSHPVRFLEDLLFAFRTNNERIYKKLLNYQLNVADHCIPRANLIRAKVNWMPEIRLPANTALIAGQVSTDKALISKTTGKFVNLSDHMNNLFEICESHPLVLFKPHPYQHINCPSRRAIEAFGMVKVVSSNFYYLLAQENISDIYAINSGTVSEAPYFNKKGHMLGQALYQFGEIPPQRGLTSGCIPLSNEFLHPQFWADILNDIIPVNTQLPSGPEFRPSLLRRSLNADWDYSFIDEVVQRNINLNEFVFN